MRSTTRRYREYLLRAARCYTAVPMRIESPYKLGLNFPTKLAFALVAGLIAASWSLSIAAEPDQVVATVGNHNITEKELDAKIKPQLAPIESQIYDLKVQALNAMADEYLIDQAAKKENLSTADYLKKSLSQHKLTETDAKM